MKLIYNSNITITNCIIEGNINGLVDCYKYNIMYYVYALIDPRTNKPFYIGKGTGNRVLSHEKFKSDCNNTYKDSIIKKILDIY